MQRTDLPRLPAAPRTRCGLGRSNSLPAAGRTDLHVALRGAPRDARHRHHRRRSKDHCGREGVRR
eukprot:6601898-Prymnesium_polylepis.1